MDPTQLELVVLNLVINARDAMPAGGQLSIATANLHRNGQGPSDLPPGDYVVVSVRDTGIGMDRDVLTHAFEPFFTTKGVGKGSGLGLAQVYGFAKQSGGDVQIESHVDHGTTVHIYLPRAAHAPAADPAQSGRSFSSLAGRRILLVDDDSAVRHVTQTMLTELGCEVAALGDALAAIALLRTPAPFDLLLADFAMPELNGAELMRHAAQLRPALPTIIITGYADVEPLDAVPAASLLQKPFRREQLADKMLARLSA